MNATQALDRLKEIKTTMDPEAAHGQADQVLCSLLIELGYINVVEAYEAIEPKWYA